MSLVGYVVGVGSSSDESSSEASRRDMMRSSSRDTVNLGKKEKFASKFGFTTKYEMMLLPQI